MVYRGLFFAAAFTALCAFDRRQHRFGVPRHFHLAPFVRDIACGIQHKSAALNAKMFFAVEFFQFQHAKLLAHRFIGIAQQGEGKALLGAEILVGFHAVARDADYGVAQGLEFGQQAVEIQAFGGAASGVVFGIEIHNERQMLLAVENIAVG